MNIVYKYNGTDLKTFGVRVSKGKGFLGRPERKEPKKYEYPDKHGFLPDLATPVYKEREITLDCFIVAENAISLASMFNSFSSAIMDVTAVVPMLISINGTQIYSGSVYASEISQLNKTFDQGKNVGTFTITIIEPNPTI